MRLPVHRYIGKAVSQRTVWRHLRATDCTGDEDFLKNLHESVKEFAVWWRVEVRLADLSFLVARDVDCYADAREPIVIVPALPHDGRWNVLDGAHRASYAASVGRKTIRAYAPFLW